MGLYMLPQTTIDAFDRAPELAMNVQLGINARFPQRDLSADGLERAWQQWASPQRVEPDFFLIIESCVAVTFDSRLREQLSELSLRPWRVEDGSHDFEEWYNRLPLFQLDLVTPLIPPGGMERNEALAFGRSILSVIIYGPIGPLPPVPPRPPYVYGHMQFSGITGPDDVFYRYEYFPTSRRINQSTQTVAADTYAAPFSEAQFISTGFGAVARFALPTLMPARWRWELQPRAGTQIRMGASVPLYGQSGGGVEVMFERDPTNPTGPITNRGPIANQVVLPVI